MNMSKRKSLLKTIEDYIMNEENEIDINFKLGYNEITDTSDSWVKRELNGSNTVTVDINGGTKYNS